MIPACPSVCGTSVSGVASHEARVCRKGGAGVLCRKCFAEFLGTYLLVLCGCGVVHSAVLTGAHHGLWQIAIVWGVAIMLAIYTVGAVSGAHINPAITLALAARRRFAWRLVPPYIVAQVTGAVRSRRHALCAVRIVVNRQGSAKTRHAGAGRQRSDRHVLRRVLSQPRAAGRLAGTVFRQGPPTAQYPGFRADRVSGRSPRHADSRVSGVCRNRRTEQCLALQPLGAGLHRFDRRRIDLVHRSLDAGMFQSGAGFRAANSSRFSPVGVRLPCPVRAGLGFLAVYILAPVIGAVVGAHLYDFLLRPSLPFPKSGES